MENRSTYSSAAHSWTASSETILLTTVENLYRLQITMQLMLRWLLLDLKSRSRIH